MLAAGMGRRLASITAAPKWLTPVNDGCPADAHLSAFEEVGVGCVHVVVYPGASAIEDHLLPWRDRLDLRLVVNEHPADRNNWYSLLLGLDEWGETASEDLVVINSDLFAGRAWFAEAMSRIVVAGHPAALAVDPQRGRTEEAMKIAIDPSGDRVVAIGKVGIDAPAGEYIGMAWWSGPSARELRGVLHGFLSEPARADNWYEHAIQVHLDAGAAYSAVPVPSSQWVEIDDAADLEAARQLRGTK